MKILLRICIYMPCIIYGVYWLTGMAKMASCNDLPIDRASASCKNMLAILNRLSCREFKFKDNNLYEYEVPPLIMCGKYSPFDKVFMLQKILFIKFGYTISNCKSKKDFDCKSGYEIKDSDPREIWVYDKYNKNIKARYSFAEEKIYFYGVPQNSVFKNYPQDNIVFVESAVEAKTFFSYMLIALAVIIPVLSVVSWVTGIIKREKILLLFPVFFLLLYAALGILVEGNTTPLVYIGYTLLVCSIFNIIYSLLSEKKKENFSVKQIRVTGFVMFIMIFLMWLVI